MKKFEDLASWSPKRLRTLRNNLNNRLASFSNSGDKAKDLQKSHALYDLDEGECRDLLQQVQKELKNKKMQA